MTLAEKLIVEYTSMALIFSVGSANVAQLVEQRIRNAWVAGSSPAVGSIEFAGQSLMRLAFLLFLARIALPKKQEYGADTISSASKYRQKVAKCRAFALRKRHLSCILSFFAAALLEVYVSCCSFCWTLILLERIKIGMLGLA